MGGSNIWNLLTNTTERKRLEDTTTCLRKCQSDHEGQVVDTTFCILDTCGQQVLDCYHDVTCREAVKCLPDTVGQCAMPSLDAYVHDEVYKNSIKCIGCGLACCGRPAVAMLR